MIRKQSVIGVLIKKKEEYRWFLQFWDIFVIENNIPADIAKTMNDMNENLTN